MTIAGHMETTWRDLVHASRLLARAPLSTTISVLTIAVGLGTVTVAFTGVNALLFTTAARPVPGAGWIFVDDRGQTEGQASYREYQAFVRDLPAVDVAASSIVAMSRRGNGPAELVFGLAVSDNYFDLFDARAARGRTFRSDERQAAVIVSDTFWRETLNEASLTGLTVTLNGLAVPVLGVMPADYRRGTYDPSVWVRIADWEALGLPNAIRSSSSSSFDVYGRLRGSTSRELADSQLQALSRSLSQTWPDTNANRRASFVPFDEGTPEIRAIQRAAAIVLALIGVVLLIALFNVAGLQLARAVDREREMSLRTALGADRARLIRQLITEGFVIAALGGALALMVARFSSVILRSFAMQAPVPTRIALEVDWRVVAFTSSLVVLCGVAAGLVSARRATRADLVSVMSPSNIIGGRRESRIRSAVIGVQLGGATMLLIMAGLLVRNAVLSAGKDVGFERENVLLVELFPAIHGYSPAAAERLVDNAVTRVRELPGVVTASAADRIPFYIGFRWQVKVATERTPCEVQDCPSVSGYRVGANYFRSMNIPMVRGRELGGSPGDAQSAVVSETMARRLWPSSDPVGQWATIGGQRRVQIVGVAADVLHRGLGEAPEPYLYLPLDDDAFGAPVTLIVRTAGNPGPLLPAAAGIVRSIDAALPIVSLQTMAQRLDGRARAGSRIIARFFGVCGALGLFLSIVGLAGAVAYSVRQRTRELGIRAAVGATPGQLRAVVLGGEMRVVAIAIAAGMAGAYVMTRVGTVIATGVDFDSPAVFGLVAVLQLVIAAAAAAIPGERATRVDPLAGLRGF
jgi:putative ABC transport system permease protein